MKKLIFFIPLLLFSFIKYQNLKPFYYQNQIIHLKAKIIFSKETNLSVLPTYKVETSLKKINPFLYKLDIIFKADNSPENKIFLITDKIETINLNSLIKTVPIKKPPLFSNVFAKNLSIINPISSVYKKDRILISFTIKCDECNIEDFSLPITEQNLTLKTKNEASYYAIIPKNKKFFTFYYFNLLQNKFDKITIPIKLKQETISTQTNINPENQTFFTPVNTLLLGIISFFLIIFIIYQRIWILIFPLIIGGYLLFQIIPKGSVILKPNTAIHILPTSKSTVIYETKTPINATILKKTDGYIKVKINNKIGWVKNENTK